MAARVAIALAAATMITAGCGSSRPSAQVRHGAQLFARNGCLNCHGYGGVGAVQGGGPNLTREGRRDRGQDWQIRHLRRPASVVPRSKMPSYAALSKDDLDAMAAFLEDSDGRWHATDFWYGSGV